MTNEPALSSAAVLSALEEVVDPELGVDVVNLGLVYKVETDPDQGNVRVEMTLTSPACPLGTIIRMAARQAIAALPGVQQVMVDFVWSPPWDPNMMSPAAKAQLGQR